MDRQGDIITAVQRIAFCHHKQFFCKQSLNKLLLPSFLPSTQELLCGVDPEALLNKSEKEIFPGADPVLSSFLKLSN